MPAEARAAGAGPRAQHAWRKAMLLLACAALLNARVEALEAATGEGMGADVGADAESAAWLDQRVHSLAQSWEPLRARGRHPPPPHTVYPVLFGSEGPYKWEVVVVAVFKWEHS
jgi:hypothetical protein